MNRRLCATVGLLVLLVPCVATAQIVDRQIGVLKMPRDRYVAWQAGEGAGSFTTPCLKFDAAALALKVDAHGGEVRVQFTDADGMAIRGFEYGDCQPSPSMNSPCQLPGRVRVSDLRGRIVRLDFSLIRARLFALETR